MSVEKAGKEAIIGVVETAGMFHGKKIIAVPLLMRLEGGVRTSQEKWDGAVESFDPQPIFNGYDCQLPVFGVRGGVEIAKIHENFCINFDGSAGTHQSVLNVSIVFSVLHPDA